VAEYRVCGDRELDKTGERYTGGRLSNPNEKVDFLESLLGLSQAKCFLQNILALK